ncbi:nedd4-binding protein 2-like 2 [Limosa lapponica baueri]|uniref:Nedd4-binding protein 2-like 2 n=1 Tax=Limosa lapponica baueri TaxID=1758121 RepID=A0A2I0T060_LIMLA|nr:nedd4-binding protein 2-like 2 [Limosa lapponica baueri]
MNIMQEDGERVITKVTLKELGAIPNHTRQSRRLLECIKDNILSQVIDSPISREMILDLMVTNASELIGDVKIGGSLGCGDRALVEFTVLRDMGQANSKFLNFRKAKFQLFKELACRIPWSLLSGATEQNRVGRS